MNNSINAYLLDVQKKCFMYSDMYIETSKKHSTKNTWFNIVNIVITGGIATLTASAGSMDKEGISYTVISVISPLLLYVSATLNSIQQFLNFEKLSEKDRTLAIRFASLGNNIKRFLCVEELEKQDKVEYFKWVNTTFEELMNKTTYLERQLSDENIPSIHEEPNDVYKIYEDTENLNNDMARIKYETDRFITDSYK